MTEINLLLNSYLEYFKEDYINLIIYDNTINSTIELYNEMINNYINNILLEEEININYNIIKKYFDENLDYYDIELYLFSLLNLST